ncbi:MAG: divalent-cation tolerance protein CutA [Acidobacteria bacterium]|nr:divalent-cation tolerance protein CutA [Acidobacteriota bacterium]
MTDKIVVLTTCASAEEAEKIARALVERRLAACVNVLPQARSFYRWKGALEDAAEWLLLIKSKRERFDQLCAALEALHSYEVPEIIALTVVDGSPAYLDWLEAEVE